MKNRKGFTLMEMMCVVAIIIFISAVAITNVSGYMKKARDLDASVQAHSAQARAQQAAVDEYLNFSRDYAVPATADTKKKADKPAPAPEPSAPPMEAPTLPPEGTPSEPTSPESLPPETTTQPSTEPETTPSQPAPDSKPDNISNLPGKVTKGDNSSTVVSVGNANDWGADARQVNVKGNKPIYSITVRVEGGSPKVQDVEWRYEVKDLGNGVFEVTYKVNDKYNLPIDSLSFMYMSDRGTSTANIQVQEVQYYEA